MRFFRALFPFFAAIVSSAFAFAASTSADLPHVHVQLVVPTNLVAGQDAQAGLYFKLEQGWHVYWKNAGDAGEPPHVRWTLPEGVTADGLQFPAPRRLALGPLMDFGYEDEVLFPITLHAASGAKAGDTTLRAKVDWLVCRGLKMQEERCGSVPGGMSMILDRLKHLISEDRKAAFSDINLIDAGIQNGFKTRLNGKDYDFSHLAPKINSHIRNIMQ